MPICEKCDHVILTDDHKCPTVDEMYFRSSLIKSYKISIVDVIVFDEDLSVFDRVPAVVL